MPSRIVADFDIDALHAAIEDVRRVRGLSWQQVAREVSRPFDGLPSRPISASKISGMRKKIGVEEDGVLQILRWLGRSPESFVPGYDEVPIKDTALPSIPLIRFFG